MGVWGFYRKFYVGGALRLDGLEFESLTVFTEMDGLSSYYLTFIVFFSS
jgi:hypothetical protein